MAEQEDSELLRQYALSDSEEAFATLVHRHIGLVYSVAVRQLGDHQKAEEVTQAVFIILAQKARTLQKETLIQGWLYQTARLISLRCLRDEIRRQRREQKVQSMITDSHAETEREDMSPLLDEAMAQLGALDRNAILLRYFENRSFADVAQRLDTNESAVQKRISRAVEKLRSFFARRGVKVSATVLVTTISASSLQAAPAGLASTVTAAAVVKGAAASGSTLLLIKGVLKTMAWTKVKISAITTLVILLTVGIGVQAAKEHHENLRGKIAPKIVAGGDLAVLKVDGSVGIMTDRIFERNGPHLIQLSKDNDWAEIASDYGFALAIKSDGSLWEWRKIKYTSPDGGAHQSVNSPVRVGKDSDWVKISLHMERCLAMKSDGTLWAWKASNNFKENPTQVGTDHDWALFSASIHCLAIKSDGSLWAWGDNANGQLGDGTRGTTVNAHVADKSDPVRIGTDTDWSQVSAGANYSAAIKKDGTLWTWGCNLNGELGNGDRGVQVVHSDPILIPTRIGTDNDWWQVVAVTTHTLALKKDGSLWVWGWNHKGQVGDGTTNDRPVPTRIGNATDWTGIAGGAFSRSFGLKKDGTLWRWGCMEDPPILNPVEKWAQKTTTKLKIPVPPTMFQRVNLKPVKIGELGTYSPSH